MKFLNVVEELQNRPENKNRIIIVRCGAFFNAIGKDAVILSIELKLRNTCIKKRDMQGRNSYKFNA